MSFAAPAEHYDRFMGRYSGPLGVALADAAGVGPGIRVLDVGCGPGALTGELVRRVGAERVAAIDPAAQFAAVCGERHPGADVRVGGAEALPWEDGSFDVVLACLVLLFMDDPEQGVREMVRVARPGGTVAACVWDTATGGMAMFRTFWDAARALDPAVEGERAMPGTADGDIAARLQAAGLQDVGGDPLVVRVEYPGFDDFWEPFTYGIGPAGAYLLGLPAARQDELRATCRASLPDGPFGLDARAWFARGTVPGPG